MQWFLTYVTPVAGISAEDTIIQVSLQWLRDQPPRKPNAGPDCWLWRNGNEDYKQFFSSKATWDQIRQSSPRVTWHKVIWFPYHIPRYAFISWLAIRDRLATGARSRAWGSTQRCTLCGEPNETRDHLFFACPYSFTVWTNLCGNLIGRTITPDWTYTLQSLTQNRRSKQDNILIKLSFRSTI